MLISNYVLIILLWGFWNFYNYISNFIPNQITSCFCCFLNFSFWSSFKCTRCRLFSMIIYLFIFNLFIIDKFISITTRIAFHKQQDLSQTPGAVNKIVECWYCWHQTFETKSPFVVLIKINPKQKRKKKKRNLKKQPMQPTDNWHYIIMNW